MSKRRTNPHFMSDEEAAQERFWLQKMVRGITRTNQPDEKSAVLVEVKKQDQPIVVGPEFWVSDKGQIMKAKF